MKDDLDGIEEFLKWRSLQKPFQGYTVLEDGAVEFEIPAPKGAKVLAVLDEVDKDLADSRLWRVNYVNGYPYVISRVGRVVRLANFVVIRKYKKENGHGQFGTGNIAYVDGNRLNFRRMNLLLPEERNLRKRWEISLRKQAAKVKREHERKEREETQEARKAARREEWENKLEGWRKAREDRQQQYFAQLETYKKVKEDHRARYVQMNPVEPFYKPTLDEDKLGEWIGAIEVVEGAWVPYLKTSSNKKPAPCAVPFSKRYPTELAALEHAMNMWKPYSPSAAAVEIAQSKLNKLDIEKEFTEEEILGPGPGTGPVVAKVAGKVDIFIPSMTDEEIEKMAGPPIPPEKLLKPKVNKIRKK